MQYPIIPQINVLLIPGSSAFDELLISLAKLVQLKWPNTQGEDKDLSCWVVFTLRWQYGDVEHTWRLYLEAVVDHCTDTGRRSFL